MKNLLFKIMALTFSGFALASCGGGNGGHHADSDSVSFPESSVETSTVVKNYLTKDSIGHVYVGKPLAELPDSVPGLYSHKENGASPDAVSVTFSNADGQQFVAYDFGEGNVDVINVIGEDIYVATPDGEIKMGDSFKKVLQLPGAKAEWSGYDDSGSWFWTWEGIWFAPAGDRLTPELSKVMYQSSTEPTAEMFSEEVPVGFIGTGLPF